QSASARFERFFNTGSSPSTSQPSGLPFGSSTGPLSPGAASGLASNGAFGSFGHSLAPGGATSSGGSGHFGSSSGLRKNTRSGIPAQWGNANGPAEPAGDSPPNSTASPTAYFNSASQAGSAFLNHGPAPAAATSPSAALIGDDDIIPTAIVVKNIPFSIKKEQLLQIIEDLAIPVPYAFNYHFDQGVFRGLAFANFRTGEEADAVVAALNGFDVSGRKLRVEYKKVLQAGEKERIEKEKAIKRMQSMQLEKERERERRRQEEYGAHHYLMPGQHTHAQGPSDALYNDPNSVTSQTFDHLPPAPRAPLTADSLKAVPSSAHGPSHGAASDLSGGAPSAAKKEELDLNDAATLEIYSRVLLFKDDRMRDELSFSKNLSALERRTVHLVAQRLGLYHYSMGEGEERYVIVTKNEVPTTSRPLRSQASTIGRSQRGIQGYSSGLAPGGSATVGRSGLLRMKKSAPDMKRSAMSEREGAMGSASSFQNSGLMVPASLQTRRSNSNLREGYSASMGRRPAAGGVGGAAGLQSLFASPFDVPPVPSLGSSGIETSTSNLNGHGSSSSLNQSSNLLRQPRGPPTPGSSDTRSFTVRSRVQVGAGGGTNGS
ncbi:hypothetical protein IE53DRAFT_300786, partial [Violaceomyces palustris]